MPGPNNLTNVTFSGATGKIRWGAKPIAITKIGFPKEAIKYEKIRHIGEMVAHVQTVGIYEADDFTAEVTEATWSSVILPNLPENGGTLFDFPVTFHQKHPTINGAPYIALADRCRIVGLEGDLEASEKANIKKIVLSTIQVFHAGKDRKWKSLAYRPSAPSPTAAQFMF